MTNGDNIACASSSSFSSSRPSARTSGKFFNCVSRGGVVGGVTIPCCACASFLPTPAASGWGWIAANGAVGDDAALAPAERLPGAT